MMRKQRWTLRAIAWVVALGMLAMFSSTALAQAPPIGDPPTKPLEVETMWVTSVTVETIPIPPGHPLAFTQSAGCASHQWVGELRERRNGEWVAVARMKSKTSWCYNGATVQPELNFRASTTMIAANWEEVSFRTREWGGIDEWEHEDQAIGKYRKCVAFLPCSSTRTMRVNKWQWGDGDSDINAHN